MSSTGGPVHVVAWRVDALFVKVWERVGASNLGWCRPFLYLLILRDILALLAGFPLGWLASDSSLLIPESQCLPRHAEVAAATLRGPCLRRSKKPRTQKASPRYPLEPPGRPSCFVESVGDHMPSLSILLFVVKTIQVFCPLPMPGNADVPSNVAWDGPSTSSGWGAKSSHERGSNRDKSGQAKQVIVQVKSGYVGVNHVRDQKGVIEREKSAMARSLLFASQQNPCSPKRRRLRRPPPLSPPPRRGGEFERTPLLVQEGLGARAED
jgi:hypothetical protein